MLSRKLTLHISIAFMLFLFSPSIYATTSIEYETLLYGSPNIELSEFILVLNNNLELSLLKIEQAMQKVLESTESKLIKDIRKTHLYFLTAFSYTYHEPSKKQKKSKSELAFTAIDTTITLGENIIAQLPSYSDMYRIVSTCMMLSAEHGLMGISKFLLYQQKVIEYIQKAIELNPNNPMARVTLSNFDTLGNFIVGANKKRGQALIFVPIQESWPKVFTFEFLNSQAIVYKKTKNTSKYQETIQVMKTLYLKSYRYTQLENY